MLYCLRAWLSRARDPFIDGLKKNVLVPSMSSTEIEIIENYRMRLARNRDPAEGIHFGAGSRSGNKPVTISGRARRSSIKSKYGLLLYNLAGWLKPETIIELGTAYGISTLYLAMGNPDTRVFTVEGNSMLSGLAGKCFSECKLNNITVFNGSFDEVLPDILTRVSGNVLAFIDGNHTYEATLHYFHLLNTSVKNITLVFDDINWSAEMRSAWKEIENSPETGTTVDLFQMGIVFQGNRKMNAALWY